MTTPNRRMVIVALAVLALVSVLGFGSSRSFSYQADVATAVSGTLTAVAKQTNIAATVAAVLGSGSAQATPVPTSGRSRLEVDPSMPTATAAAVAPPAPTAVVKAAPPGPQGKIAFSVCEGMCDLDEKKSIWIINADGSGLRQVVERASEPSFSPDGSQIAYYHYPDGIYIVNSNGTDPTGGTPVVVEPGKKPPLVTGKKIVGDTMTCCTDWSHNGRWVAFSSRPAGIGNVNIDIVPPDGTALKDSNARRTIVVGIGSSWSPDDTQFVFNTCRGGTCGIFRSGTTPGSEAIPVVGDNGNAPAWSPDGQRILYQVDIDGARQLVIINADGTGKKQLTSGAVMHVAPTWSVDGGYIFYRSPEGGSWGIWRIQADGSNPVRLIDNVPPVDWAFERLAAGR